MWTLLALVACTEDDPRKKRDEEPVTDENPDPGDDDDDDDDDVTTQPDPCDPDEGLQIEDVEVSQPWTGHELQVEVTLSMAASVAVACTLREDPSEVHLVEGVEEATSHELRMAGLLAESDYDCVAAAVCPASTEPFSFSVSTGPLPEGVVGVEATDYGGAGSEYVLFNQSRDCDYQYQRLNVMDRHGRLRWWYATPEWVGPSVEFRYHGDTLFEWGGGWDPNSRGRPRLVDLYEGELYDSAVAMSDTEESNYHHDGKRLSDGRLLTLETEYIEDGNFDGFRVRRIDPDTDTVDFEYRSQRAYDDGHLPRGWGGDPWHANWVDIVDEVLYVSLCNLARIIAIDVPSGELLWTFGADGDFSLVDSNGDPLGDDGFTQCQHGLEYTEDDRLLVYDNGNDRGYTRVSEYQLDPYALSATMLWTWTEDDWWETTLGDADYMDDGRILVGAGHSDCFSSNPGDRVTILEIDPTTGEKLWQLRYIDRNLTAYRADWADACDLFANAAYCPEIGERLTELSSVLTP
jgi:hypothetical protein